MAKKNSFLLSGRYLNLFKKNISTLTDNQIKEFAEKWLDLTDKDINEIDYYESFGEDLFTTIVGLKKFNGKKGEWGTQKGLNRRTHDIVIGPCRTNNNEIVTAVEMKSPSCSLDIDLNNKGC